MAALVAVATVWAAAGPVHWALGNASGLRAEYFAGSRRLGRPALTTNAREISTREIARNWDGSPPAAFSVRWYGYLAVTRRGAYTFATQSNGPSALWIDGAPVVANDGTRRAEAQAGTIELDRGAHIVTLEYTTTAGAAEIAWTWARAPQVLAPVPRWALSETRVAVWKVQARRAAGGVRGGAIWVLAAGFVLLAARRFLVTRPETTGRSGESAASAGAARWPQTSRHAATFLFFAVLAAVHTWPLASDPAGLSRNDNDDTVLNEWIMAWVAHQAVRDPLDLFHANIFHPEPYTLAYSEPLIVQGLLSAPIRWAGGSPVLAYNVVLLAGLALTGWTMTLVVSRWTGDGLAGVLSGVIFAFNAHTTTRLAHMQAQHVEFLPLALLVLDQLLRDPAIGRAVRLACWFVLQSLTSVYLLVIGSLAMLAAVAARPQEWLGARFRRSAAHLALAAAIAGGALLPFLLPYWHAYADQGFVRTLEEAAGASATWADYLSTPGRLHYAWWSHRWFTGNALFPGGVALALTGVAVARGVAFGDPRARMCLAIGLAGLAFSFGTKLPGYIALYELTPVLRAIRVPLRFGYLVILATAVLAGFGGAALRRALPARAGAAAAAVLIALAFVEPLAAPLALRRFAGIPAIYRTLQAEPAAVVVELPFPAPRAAFTNAPYMLHATAHWRPLVNGYSGFVPRSYAENYERLSGFPDARSLAALRELGVTHVFVHRQHVRPHVLEEIDRSPVLSRVAVEASIALYRVI